MTVDMNWTAGLASGDPVHVRLASARLEAACSIANTALQPRYASMCPLIERCDRRLLRRNTLPDPIDFLLGHRREPARDRDVLRDELALRHPDDDRRDRQLSA